MALKERGVVKWFNDAKGFGFIEHSSGQDVFVHYSVIEWDGFKTLKDGEEVHYELVEGDKGLHAAKVTRVKTPETEQEASSAESVDDSKKSAEEPSEPELPIGSIAHEAVTQSVEEESTSIKVS